MKHHPIFYEFDKWSGKISKDYNMNFIGAQSHKSFLLKNYEEVNDKHFVYTDYPSFDEEYFEWIDLLESVIEFGEKFTMIELGAGYGRWIVNGAFACKHKNKSFTLCGVEAEPSHFKMLGKNIADNLGSSDNISLINAAVSNIDNGEVLFATGHPEEWYGQSIVNDPNFKMTDFPDSKVMSIKTITLNSILEQYQSVYLIDLDIQGHEFKALSCSIDEINKKVKKIHIGTHSTKIEEDLRELFINNNWEKKWDFNCNMVNTTPFGDIYFQDGVQTWKNLRYY